MLLSIIVKDSEKYKRAIQATCGWVGINNYEILDPKYNELGGPLSLVLYIGEPTNVSIPTSKNWSFGHYPSADLALDVKQQFVNILKEIKEYMELNNDPDTIKKNDIPTVQSLKDFLNSLTGRVVEIRLPDRRKLGIYPDHTKLECKYDLEFHASTIVNLSKLFHLFDASEIVVKEI